MLKKLEWKFNKLEYQREELLALASAGTENKLKAKPYGKWSVLEILSHIVTAEQLSQAYLQKKMQGLDSLPDAGWSSWFRSALLTLSQRVPLKYRAPRRVVENTPPGLPLREIKDRWDQSRSAFAQLLERFKDNTAHKAVYRHPAVGYLNIGQMLTFYRDHIVHHRPQIVSRLRA